MAGTGTKDSDTQMDHGIKIFMRIRGNVYSGLFVISLDDRNSEAPKQWSVFVSGPISDSIAAVLGKWSCLVGQRGGIELR